MKILVTPTSFFSEQNKEAREKLEKFADTIIRNPHSRPLEAEEILSLMDGVDGYIAGLDYITADIIHQAPKELKVISRYGAGYDRVDLQATRERGIIVTNTPGVNSVAVCELTFGLMLALSRSIPVLDGAVKGGDWPRHNGIELCGKTLGIIGFGSIGKELAQRAVAFGMKVLAYDPFFDESYASKFNVVQSCLDEIYAKSDFISLHLPLNQETRHIINENSIGKMKKGAFLINTARGGLIDENAASIALVEGQIGGIALDVFEKEPVTESALFGKKNVILTPHTGAHTKEAISKMGLLAVDNLINELSGEVTRYRVT